MMDDAYHHVKTLMLYLG